MILRTKWLSIPFIAVIISCSEQKKHFCFTRFFSLLMTFFYSQKTQNELPSKGCIWKYNHWLLRNYENKNVRLVWKNIQYKFY